MLKDMTKKKYKFKGREGEGRTRWWWWLREELIEEEKRQGGG